MAYGMLLQTPDGMQSVDTLRSAQLVLKVYKTAKSGSQALPAGITASNAFAFIIPRDGLTPSSVSLSGSTLVWTLPTFKSASYFSASFDILVLRHK